jgi:hypothetical protein
MMVVVMPHHVVVVMVIGRRGGGESHRAEGDQSDHERLHGGSSMLSPAKRPTHCSYVQSRYETPMNTLCHAAFRPLSEQVADALQMI